MFNRRYKMAVISIVELAILTRYIIVVTAVLPNGRSSPADAGLWDNAQIPSFKRVVDFVHEIEGGEAKIGIQLGHAGRKASMMPIYPGQPIVRASASDGGWEDEVWGASPVPFDTNYVTPKEMSIEHIRVVVDAFGDAAKRAIEAGFGIHSTPPPFIFADILITSLDFIEVHAAHGYLLSSFLSPASNHRTDLYGGSFQNRTRFLFEVLRKMRQAIPDKIAFSVRISAVDWMAHSPCTPQWTLKETVELAVALADMGVDVLDVSSGGNNIMQQVPKETFYQISLAERIKFALRGHGKDILVGAVGRISEASIAEETLREKGADLALVATQFLRDPNLVYRWSEELDAHVQWPRQYCRADRKAKVKENL